MGRFDELMAQEQSQAPSSRFEELIGAEKTAGMNPKAAAAVGRLLSAARAAGQDIGVKSGARTGEEQKSLFSEFLSGKRTTPVAKPGTSHHEGLATAVDLATKGSKPAADWLTKNAALFGLKNTIPSEPWHHELMGGGPPEYSVDVGEPQVEPQVEGLSFLLKRKSRPGEDSFMPHDRTE